MQLYLSLPELVRLQLRECQIETVSGGCHEDHDDIDDEDHDDIDDDDDGIEDDADGNVR